MHIMAFYVCDHCRWYHRLNDRRILYEKYGICLHRSTSKINIDSYNEICCTQISSSTRKKYNCNYETKFMHENLGIF